MTNKELAILLDGVCMGVSLSLMAYALHGLNECRKDSLEYRMKITDYYGDKIQKVDDDWKAGKIDDKKCERLKKKYAMKLFKKLNLL